MSDQLPQNSSGRSGLNKYTVLGGGAVIALILVQVLLLRVTGDLITSALIFGIGYIIGRRPTKRRD